MVELDEEDVERISDKWATQMGRPPSEQELSELVADFVRDEIYYREAQRLSLNANDSIVRARMIQKLTFLTEDIATGVSLSDELYDNIIQKTKKTTRFRNDTHFLIATSQLISAQTHKEMR